MRASIRSILGPVAGLGALAVARRRVADAPDRFYGRHVARAIVSHPGGPTFTLPMTYHRTETIVSVHPVAFGPVRSLLPTGALHPVRLPDGRALLALAASRYLEGTAEATDPRDLPYGELMVTILVTPEPSPPVMPILRALLPWGTEASFGGFLVESAVTGRGSRDIGRALGYPTFVADFRFEDRLTERAVRVSEDGHDILRLRVAARGRVAADRRDMVVYNVRGEELLETICPCSGFAQQSVGRRAGFLELGDHPVAEELRALRPSSTPLTARSYLNLRLIIPPSRVIGTARPWSGYAGDDRERGEYAITYGDGSTIDLARGTTGSGAPSEAAPGGPTPRGRRARVPVARS